MQQLATLRYDGTSIGEAAPGPVLAAALGERADAERRQATVEYWLGRYADLVDRQAGATDADVLFVAANAAFRTARLDRQSGRRRRDNSTASCRRTPVCSSPSLATPTRPTTSNTSPGCGTGSAR